MLVQLQIGHSAGFNSMCRMTVGRVVSVLFLDIYYMLFCNASGYTRLALAADTGSCSWWDSKWKELHIDSESIHSFHKIVLGLRRMHALVSRIISWYRT